MKKKSLFSKREYLCVREFKVRRNSGKRKESEEGEGGGGRKGNLKGALTEKKTHDINRRERSSSFSLSLRS